MVAITPVAVIGAGPYGLSVSAHLSARDVEHRVFGRLMSAWAENMPVGMYLKSEGFASDLSDPDGQNTLQRFCGRHNRPYADLGLPVSLETFVAYGQDFAARAVPQLETVEVTTLSQTSDGTFELRLSDGTVARAQRVVLAIGVGHFTRVPDSVSKLGQDLASHSSAHHNLSVFAGRDITVLGGGQSALETAALLHECGASVRILVRNNKLDWNSRPDERSSLLHRVRYPRSRLGTRLRLFAYTNGPAVFRYLPEQVRVDAVARTLGPAGAWWLKDRVQDPIQVLLGHEASSAVAKGSSVHLKVASPEGRDFDVVTEYVIAATGYQVDMSRLRFGSPTLLARLRLLNGSPVLSRHFESSIPGLHIVGLAAAHAFGPVQRFVAGASFAARVVAAEVAKATSSHRLRRQSVLHYLL